MSTRSFLLLCGLLASGCAVPPDLDASADGTCGPFVQRDDVFDYAVEPPRKIREGPWTALPPLESGPDCRAFDAEAASGTWRLRGFRDGANRLWEVDAVEPSRHGGGGTEYDVTLWRDGDAWQFNFSTTCNGFVHSLDLSDACLSWEGATVHLVACEGCEHRWESEVHDALGRASRIFADDARLALHDDRGRWHFYFER